MWAILSPGITKCVKFASTPWNEAEGYVVTKGLNPCPDLWMPRSPFHELVVWFHPSGKAMQFGSSSIILPFLGCKMQYLKPSASSPWLWHTFWLNFNNSLTWAIGDGFPNPNPYSSDITMCHSSSRLPNHGDFLAPCGIWQHGLWPSQLSSAVPGEWNEGHWRTRPNPSLMFENMLTRCPVLYYALLCCIPTQEKTETEQ